MSDSVTAKDSDAVPPDFDGVGVGGGVIVDDGLSRMDHVVDDESDGVGVGGGVIVRDLESVIRNVSVRDMLVETEADTEAVPDTRCDSVTVTSNVLLVDNVSCCVSVAVGSSESEIVFLDLDVVTWYSEWLGVVEFVAVRVGGGVIDSDSLNDLANVSGKLPVSVNVGGGEIVGAGVIENDCVRVSGGILDLVSVGVSVGGGVMVVDGVGVSVGGGEAETLVPESEYDSEYVNFSYESEYVKLGDPNDGERVLVASSDSEPESVPRDDETV